MKVRSFEADSFFNLAKQIETFIAHKHFEASQSISHAYNPDTKKYSAILFYWEINK